MPISNSCLIAENVKILYKDLVNLYGCEIGEYTQIGPFVEIQKNAIIGKKCKISSHSFLCEGVEIADQVFIGHGVMFINDNYPLATNSSGDMKSENDWQLVKTKIKSGASIGSNATILGGITIGKDALIGAGAVISKDVPDYKIVIGNDNQIIGDVREKENSK